MTYQESINEAALRSPAMKQKIKQLQKELEAVFKDQLYSTHFDYNVDVSDLQKLFSIANKYFFKGKLDLSTTDIVAVNEVRKDKGTFKAGNDISRKDLIGIVKYDKDNAYQIVNVFLHEMVHLYDSKFGPLKDVINTAFVDNIAGRQHVDRYDAHGKYFKDYCNKINAYGFDIKEKYSVNDKRVMKKIDEKRNTDKFFDNESKEDDEQYKRVKAAYDKLKNCNKAMVYRDAKHWYIQID